MQSLFADEDRQVVGGDGAAAAANRAISSRNFSLLRARGLNAYMVRIMMINNWLQTKYIFFKMIYSLWNMCGPTHHHDCQLENQK